MEGSASREDVSTIVGVVLTDDARLAICNRLQELAASEVLAYYAYAVVAPYLHGVNRPAVEKFFGEAAKDELDDHFQSLLRRMNELRFTPSELFDFSKVQELSPCQYAIPSAAPLRLEDVIAQNAAAEECAIEQYQALVDLARESGDWTTELLAKRIQSDEWEHLSELRDFAEDLGIANHS